MNTTELTINMYRKGGCYDIEIGRVDLQIVVLL